jgi:hypothetical protein
VHLEALQLVNILEDSNTISADYMRIIRGTSLEDKPGDLTYEDWKQESIHLRLAVKKPLCGSLHQAGHLQYSVRVLLRISNAYEQLSS